MLSNSKKFSRLYDEVLPYLTEGESYCLGFSGGRDSTALLKVLCDLRKKLKFSLTALHVNHELRSNESEVDRNYCEKICKEWEVDFVLTTINVRKFAAENSLSEETAARECRFIWFKKVLVEKKSNKIFLAHHADDQAETLLFRLFRGAGLRGLGCMEPVSNMLGFEIIRPWLSIRQKVINQYRSSKNILCRYDSSNDSTKYKRNWIRHKLIPEIQSEFSDGFEDKLVQTADICRSSDDYFSSLAGELILLNSKKSIFGIAFPIDIFKEFHIAIQRALVIEMFKKQKCLFSFEIIEAVRNFILSSKKKLNIQLPGGFFAGKSWGYFYLGNRHPELSDFGVEVQFEDVFDQEKCCLDNGEAWKKVFLCEKVKMVQYASLGSKSEISIRTRKSGDCYKPVNGHQKKIKKLFIDSGIPQDLKSAIPIIEKNGEIVWVAGWRISERFKVKPDKKVFKLTIVFNKSY